MTHPNPFPGLWREQHLLVIERGCVFPQRCVCCDAEEVTQDQKFERLQSWRDLEPYKNKTFGPIHTCVNCRKKFERFKRMEYLFYLIICLMALVGRWPFAAVVLTYSLMVIYICRKSQVIKLEKLDDEKAWFSGFPPAFLDQLPDFRERSRSRQDVGEPSGEQ